jgi:K(+)-stimulated pyrophosphate-energized sodium pump
VVEAATQAALNFGNYVSVVVSAVVSPFIIRWMLPEDLLIRGVTFNAMDDSGRRCGTGGGTY